MAIEQVRIIRVQGRAEGMELVTTALERVAGATVKVTQASDGLSAATEAQSRKTLSLSKAWETFQAKSDIGFRSQQQFARGISDVTRFYEQGIIGAQRYGEEVSRLKNILQSGVVPGGAAPRIDQSSFNSMIGIKEGVEKSAKESAAAFEAGFEQLETIARQKAEQIGQNFTAALNERMGIGAVSKSARDSAAAFSAALDEFDNMASLKAAQIGRNFQEELNRSFNIGGPAATSRGATFSALEEQLNELDRVATARAAHIAEVTQRIFAEMRNIGTPPKSARESAAVFEEVAIAEERAAKSAANLRAAIDPLGAEFGRVGRQIAEYRELLKAGLISSHEFSQAQLLAGKRLSDFEKNLKEGANAGRVMSGEIVNLSYQLNDVITGLALGQSPFMILGQQGGQIFQIFQSSKASVGEFAREIGGRLLNSLTLTRVAFGGIAASVGLAALAMNDYLNTQRRVDLALTGSGRASGATTSGINSIANQGSSLTGLSVAEARELAAALAQTGRVANENILPIVKMGKDIAHAFGIEAAEATSMLAKAFSDPVRGADELNQRLGFMDAAMQRQIQNLVAQNRTMEAQQVLIRGMESSVKGVGEAVATSTHFWTALGNIISNAWDKIGEGASRMTGIGLRLGLDEEIQKVTARIKELEELAARRSAAVNRATGTTAELERQRAELERLTVAQRENTQSVIEAQQRRDSFVSAAGVRSQIPEIEALGRLRNEQELLVRTMIDVQTTGGAASEVLKRMGVSYEELARALEIANSNLSTFKSQFDQNLAQLKIANDAITAFSPSQRGEIARRESLEATQGSKMTPAEKATLAEQAYQNAVKQSVTALREAARERELAGKFGIEAAQREIDAVGKTIGEQYRLRAELQAEQQLRQEADRNRTQIDEKHLARLKEQIAETARLRQREAERQLGSDINFERSQIGLSDSEQGINSRLRSIYGDNLNTAQAQFYAQQLRINEALRVTSDIGRDAFTGALQAIRDGKLEMTELTGILDRVASKLIDMAAQGLWQSAFGGGFGSGGGGGGLLGGLGSLFGGLFGSGGGGGSSSLSMVYGGMGTDFPIPTFGAANGGQFGYGRGWGIVGERGPELINVHSSGVSIYSNPVSKQMARSLPGFANGGGMDLSGRIFPMPSPAANGNTPNVVMQDNRVIHVGAGADAATVEQMRAMLAAERRAWPAQIEAVIANLKSRGRA